MISFIDGKYHIDGLFSVWNHIGQCSFEPHTHDFIELVYQKHGRALHKVDNAEYPMSSGQLLFINYERVHSFVSDGESEYVNVLIKPEMLSQSLSGRENAFALLELRDFSEFQDVVKEDNCLISFEGVQRKHIEMIIERLLKESQEQSPGSELALRSGFNLLLIELFRAMSLDIRPQFDGIDSALLEYIKEHCGESLTLGKLANRCGYAPGYFSRLFKKQTGKTLREYLSVHRLEKACEYLRNTDLSVDAVMLSAGFSNRTKFFELFARQMNCTPLQYRKKHTK